MSAIVQTFLRWYLHVPNQRKKADLLTAAWVTFGLLMVATLAHVVVGGYFAWMLRSARPPRRSDQPLPPVAVFLPIRGSDPMLAECLQRVLRQDYPDYIVSIVVDSPEDEAWPVVRAAVANIDPARVTVETLNQPLATCGRKCSALLQMLAKAPADREVVVFVDSDVLLHASSLRELVNAFHDPKVGAAFGNRWFVPIAKSWGSLIRYAWNANSVACMYLFQTPWAGCLAIRRSVLESVDADDRWSRALVDDACLRTAILKEGYAIRFVPSLMIVNREECDVRFALRFMMRQLAWTRLYIPTVWAQVILITLSLTGALGAGVGLTAAAAIQGLTDAMLWTGGGMLVFMSCLYGLLGLCDHAVRCQTQARGETLPAHGSALLCKLLAAIPLAMVSHLAATINATFKRVFLWRGVTYRVHNPWNIRVVHEQPVWSAAGDKRVSSL